MLNYTTVNLKPLLVFSRAASLRQIDVVYHSAIYTLTLVPINIGSTTKATALTKFYERVDRVHVFTKKNNLNKLYVDNNRGIFLSPGIILRFMNLDQSRFLKKRLKAWYGYIKALKLLQRKTFVLYMSDLYGKKSIFLNKLNANNIVISWLFIRLFSTNVPLQVKKARRVKRWIRKKYYQLEVREGR